MISFLGRRAQDVGTTQFSGPNIGRQKPFLFICALNALNLLRHSFTVGSQTLFLLAGDGSKTLGTVISGSFLHHPVNICPKPDSYVLKDYYQLYHNYFKKHMGLQNKRCLPR
jgi:hypothetical protein